MYRWVEHTSELELEIEAPTEREVLVEALRALEELIGDEQHPTETVRRELQLTAADRPSLLAAWLEELVYLAESEGFVPVAVEALWLHDVGLNAVVRGRRGEPPPLVKAVTYHRLAFEPGEGGYRARVVLDV